MRKIIVTDLTRFSNEDIVCIAGIDIDTGECIRPLPYLPISECKRLNILPGAVLSGKFNTCPTIELPHSEDMNYENLTFLGPCSDSEFKEILSASISQNIEQGFNVSLQNNQKHIPPESKPTKSIITISVNPNQIEVVQDGFDKTKIKIHFTDSNLKSYRFLAITDYGFYHYAKNHYQTTNNYNEINSVIKNQDEVFLRIGLGRLHISQQGIKGYWLQVNGIYTFPDYFKNVRAYF
ncbi:hypothetical protein JCM14076_26510 [Methylosoma difficile]